MQHRAWTFAVALFSLAACQQANESNGAPLANAQLRNGAGDAAGTAVFLPSGDGIVLVLNLTGLPPGVHGIHLHSVGRCDAPTFESAGPHLNPLGKLHGAQNPAGPHMGDLPNVNVDATGRASANFQMPVSPAVFREELDDADKASIVVHAGPDDFKTDPSGNSGDRIACGILTKA
jgi:superoxide dismutase, Cu-Zn family